MIDQCHLIFIVLAYQLDAVVLAQQLRKRFLNQVRDYRLLKFFE
jgi:hypothetical protein